jgi:HK97 family phage prohead protease
MSEEREIRSFAVTELRVDASQDGKGKTLYGYASVFDILSENLGGFKEKVAKGTFNRAVKEDDVRALFNHDPNFVLGRNQSGTLRLWEDIHGLRFENDMPDTQAARDLAESIRRGDVNQMSFAFRTLKDEWNYLEDPAEIVAMGTNLIRTLMEVKLFDVSVVTYPAYPQTTADVRGEAERLIEQRKAGAAEAGARADQIMAQARNEILRKRVQLAKEEL